MKYEVSFTAHQEIKNGFAGFVIVEADSPGEAYKKTRAAVANGQTLMWRSNTPGESERSPLEVDVISEAVLVEDSRPVMRSEDSYRVFRYRLDNYYKDHQDECPHAMTNYGPQDYSSQWIEVCCSCDKLITDRR